MYGFLEACFGLKYRLGEPLSLEPWKALVKRPCHSLPKTCSLYKKTLTFF